MDPDVDGLLTLLAKEFSEASHLQGTMGDRAVEPGQALTSLVHEAVLDAIADHLARRVLK